jgi:hypothetical protein
VYVGVVVWVCVKVCVWGVCVNVCSVGVCGCVVVCIGGWKNNAETLRTPRLQNTPF